MARAKSRQMMPAPLWAVDMTLREPERRVEVATLAVSAEEAMANAAEETVRALGRWDIEVAVEPHAATLVEFG